MDTNIINVNVPNFVSITIMALAGLTLYAAIRKAIMGRAGKADA